MHRPKPISGLTKTITKPKHLVIHFQDSCSSLKKMMKLFIMLDVEDRFMADETSISIKFNNQG